jgi:hypothetical protein
VKNIPTLFVLFLLLATRSWAQIPGPLSPLQGGENIATAFALSGPLPITTYGTTAGFLNDYDEACPYEGSQAPDVVYAFSPSSAMTVDIDLCGSSYDTKVFMYENVATPGNAYACNDDFYFDETCGVYVSKIDGVNLAAGNTYYIVIDGFTDVEFGDYVMTIRLTDAQQCTWGVDIICPPGSVTEPENCGSNTNGGCDMIPGTQHWETVPATGATFCGTTWANGGSRDTDWYSLVLTAASSVGLTVNADQQVQYGLVETTTPGAPSCATITGSLSPSTTAGPCNESFLDLGVLTPGTYWFKVQMTATNGFPCTNHYRIDFEVNPAPCSQPEQLTATGITAISADLGWLETGTATSWEYQYGLSGFFPDETGISTTNNPVNIIGLSAGTSYDFYVRSNCGATYSAWTGPYIFTTTCTGISSFPWAETFESAWPPACWTDYQAANFGWNQSISGTPHSGTQWAYCNLAGSELQTPVVTLTSDAFLSFWYKPDDPNYPQDLSVKVGSDIVYQVNGSTDGTYQEGIVLLSAYTGQTVTITFTGGTGSGGGDYGICLDDVSIKPVVKWTGLLNTAWNAPGNWSTAIVPSATDMVWIPSFPSGGHFPVVNNSITAKCYHITVSPGASVDVKPGGILKIDTP